MVDVWRGSRGHEAKIKANFSLQTLLNRQPAGSKSHIAIFGAFDPSRISSYDPLKGKQIDDPYYGGASGFDKCYEQCTIYAKGFLDFIERGGQ